MVTIVEQYVDTTGPQGPEGVDPANKPGGDPSGHPSLDNVNETFLGLWYALIDIISKMRDILQNYNENQKRYGWNLYINQYDTQMQSINERYKSSLTSGVLSVLGGMIGIVAGGLGIGLHPGWSTIGSVTTEGVGGAGTSWSGYYTKEANILDATAGFEGKMADQYDSTLGGTLQRARSLIGDILKAAQEAVQLYGNLLQSLNSNK